MKFIPGVEVLKPGRTVYFSHPNDSVNSQLAKSLFKIPGVGSVMLGEDFITINKNDSTEWRVLKPEVFAAILDFFNSNKPILEEDTALDTNNKNNQLDDSEIVTQIKNILDTKIRPVVQEDGGDIIFKSFDENTGVVKLTLQGSCSNCPSSSVTLKNGAKNMLKFFIPEVKDVEEDQDDLSAQSDKIFEQLQNRLKKIKKETQD